MDRIKNFSVNDDLKLSYTIPLNGYKKENKKHFAFTLAEVLITLTIIGVVAAMTIPTLMGKYQKHTYVVGLKKAYSEISNAIQMIPLTAGCPAGDYDCAGIFDYSPLTVDGRTYGGDGGSEKFLYYLSKNIKFAKICYLDTRDECLKNYSAKDHILGPVGITEDGMMFSSLGGAIEVDVNGYKGPNEIGRDIFNFNLATDERNNVPMGTVLPQGSAIYSKWITGSQNDSSYYWRNGATRTNPFNYTGQVLEEDAMNY